MDDLGEVETPRLILRRPCADDWRYLHRMNSDPTVMATLGGVRDLDSTKAYVTQQVEHWERHGFGWWIAFNKASAEFVGRGGIRHIEVEGQAEVEVGYALMSAFWGAGLATELAGAAVNAGLGHVGLPSLIGLSLSTNKASRRVLEKVGFEYEREALYKDLQHLLYRQTLDRQGCEDGVRSCASPEAHERAGVCGRRLTVSDASAKNTERESLWHDDGYQVWAWPS